MMSAHLSVAIFAALLVAIISAQRPPIISGSGSPQGRSLQTKNLTFVVSAKNLPNLDALGESDPFIKAYDLNPNFTTPEEFGKTEVIEDSSNPSFVKVFWYTWIRGHGQKWNFKVRDEDLARPDEEIGEATMDVDEYVNNGEKLTVKLSEGGELTVEKTTPIKFTLRAKNLPKSDPFDGESDAYVKCYWRSGSNGENKKFYQTSVINDVTDADWPDVIEFPNYIHGTDQWLVFRVKDSDDGRDDNLGEAILEVDQFVEKGQARTKKLRLGKDGAATLEVVPVTVYNL